MLLAIEGLHARRGGADVLRDVNLHLDVGEIYGLLGPNGAGKSTTIAVLLGLLPREDGSVRVFHADPAHEAPAIRARLGVLPDPNGFYDWMTAGDYLEFFAGLHRHRLEPAECKRLLSQVGLERQRRLRIGTFSRGMRQRLGLARALVGSPELLILDEPSNGLDPRGRKELHDILLELSGEREVAILLCTHLLDDVERLCHRAGFIVDGRTVLEGQINDLIRDSNGLPRFRLRLASANRNEQSLPEGIRIVARGGDWRLVELADAEPADRVWAELYARGWPITEINAEAQGLERLYLSLTERRAA